MGTTGGGPHRQCPACARCGGNNCVGTRVAPGSTPPPHPSAWGVSLRIIPKHWLCHPTRRVLHLRRCGFNSGWHQRLRDARLGEWRRRPHWEHQALWLR